MTENALYTSLDLKSQTILNVFVQSCLTLDIENINVLLTDNPSLCKVNPYESEPIFLIDSIKEIFNEFKIDAPNISTENTKYKHKNNETIFLKLFTVTYENNPTKKSNFGFIFKIINSSIIEICEFSGSKSYQKRLNERLFGGLNEEEIIKLKQAIKYLPDL